MPGSFDSLAENPKLAFNVLKMPSLTSIVSVIVGTMPCLQLAIFRMPSQPESLLE
jgi:hypothetical protein